MQKANSISQTKRAAAGKVESHRLAGRKDRGVEALDEQRQTEENDGKAADQRGRAFRHALDEKYLENDDDDQRRRQVPCRLAGAGGLCVAAIPCPP
jgi:hypothetical protein